MFQLLGIVFSLTMAVSAQAETVQQTKLGNVVAVRRDFRVDYEKLRKACVPAFDRLVCRVVMSFPNKAYTKVLSEFSDASVEVQGLRYRAIFFATADGYTVNVEQMDSGAGKINPQEALLMLDQAYSESKLADRALSVVVQTIE